MNQVLIEPRTYSDTFGGVQYGMDMEENLGYRTPFLDIDCKEADAIFDNIMQRTRKVSSTQKHKKQSGN